MKQVQGLTSALPKLLDAGIIYRCTDTNKLFVGTDRGNVEIPSEIFGRIDDQGVVVNVSILNDYSGTVTCEKVGTGNYKFTIPRFVDAVNAGIGVGCVALMTPSEALFAYSVGSSTGKPEVTFLDSTGAATDIFTAFFTIKAWIG